MMRTPNQEEATKRVLRFGREEFLDIVRVERPPVVYRGFGVHYFSMVGLTVWTSACEDADFAGVEALLVSSGRA